MPIVADSAAGLVFVVAPIIGSILSVVIVLIEAIVLRLLKWGSFGRSLRDSLYVNFASLLVGLVIGVIALMVFPNLLFYPLSNWLPFIFGVPNWLLSVLIEGWLLGRLEHYEPRRTWTAALVINMVSYLFIGGVLYLISVR
jgi:hypothetical protein